MAQSEPAPVLEACGLGLVLPGPYQGAPPVTALQGVSLRVAAGEKVAVIGRSGSGKSSLTRLLVGLPPAGARISGVLRWPDGGTVRAADPAAARRWGLGARVAWLPQDAQAALHPLLRLGSQLAETLRAAGQPAGRDAVAAALASVALDPGLVRRYPHEVSGGQAQRAALACALAAVSAQPAAVLVADEPTSALDEGTGGAILDLLETHARRGLALVVVTHDLAAAARCDRVVVLDAGRVVEDGLAEQVLTRPVSAAAGQLVGAAARGRAVRPAGDDGAASGGDWCSQQAA